MALPTITIFNLTVGVIEFTQLGFDLPASPGSYPVSDFARTDEILNDPQLQAELGASNVRIDISGGGLSSSDTIKTLEQSKAIIKPIQDLDIKHNLAGAIAPAATDDEDSGYSVGSIWIDEIADKSYICVDAASTAAVWNTIGPVTLQNAYDGGNTIVTVGGRPLDVSGLGAISLDSTVSSNFTVTGAGLTLSTTSSGGISVSAADSVSIAAGDEVAASGNIVSIASGSATGGSNDGGEIDLFAGVGFGAGTGGGIDINAGGGGVTGVGGPVTLDGGPGGGSGGDGGGVTVTGGSVTTLGTGGAVTVSGGAAVSGTGGAVTISTGASADGNSGELILRVPSTVFAGATADNISILGGSGTTTGGGSDISILGGAGGAGVFAGDAGDVEITGGASGSASPGDTSTSGAVIIASGSNGVGTPGPGGLISISTTDNFSGDGGPISITTGSSFGTGAGGNLAVTTGGGFSSGGDISFTCGGSAGVGGTISLTPGGGATSESIYLNTPAGPLTEGQPIVYLRNQGTLTGAGQDVQLFTGESVPDTSGISLSAHSASLFFRDPNDGATLPALWLNTTLSAADAPGIDWLRIATVDDVTLQLAYEGGSTIVTSVLEGILSVTGTEAITMQSSAANVSFSGLNASLTAINAAAAGDVTLTGGNSTAATNPGGDIFLNAGEGNTTGTGGTITGSGGNGGATGAGGGVSFTGGSGGAISGDGGAASIGGGVPTDGDGGLASVTGADGVGANRSGGVATVSGGDSTGTAAGAAVSITGGDGEGTAGGDGGAVNITGGAGRLGGDVVITSGPPFDATDQAGDVRIIANKGVGAAGKITLTTESDDDIGSPVTLETQSGFADQGLNTRTFGRSEAIAISTLNQAVVNLGTLADGEQLQVKVSMTAVDNLVDTNVVSFRFDGDFYRSGGTVTAMTPHVNLNTKVGSAAFTGGISFAVVISGGTILLEVSNSSGASLFTLNISATFITQQGGAAA